MQSLAVGFASFVKMTSARGSTPKHPVAADIQASTGGYALEGPNGRQPQLCMGTTQAVDAAGKTIANLGVVGEGL